MRSLFTYHSFAALTIAVIAAALLAAVWDRHGAGAAAQGTPASVASHSEMVGPGNGNAKDILASDNGAPTSDSLPSKPDQPVKTRVSEAFGKLPLSFEANDGQVDRQVKFISRGRGYNLFLTSNEAVLSLSKPARQSRQRAAAASRKTTKFHPARERAVVRMKLVGGNPASQVQGLDELPAKTNYFIGADPSKWRSVSNYAKVEYKSVYPGIDLVYYGNQRQLEYDFVIAPGADPGAIRLAFAGAQRLRIDGEGDLALRTAGGELRMRKPIVYQEVDGGRKITEGNYAISGNRAVGFKVTDYDRSRPLVIDPVLVYSTYIGGVEADSGEDIAVDSSGNAYVTGITNSESFPLVNNYPSALVGFYTVFVLKLNPAGNTILYSTHLAGSDGGLAVGKGIAIDSSGRAYVTGETQSANFPTKNAYQLNQPDTDVFMAKLDTNASGVASLLYSTYLGGSSIETGEGIAADSSGNAYVTGSTNSTNFPILNAFQGFQSREDVFVTKLNTNASGAASLLYSTYLGGVNELLTSESSAGFEHGYGIAADSSGNVYVTGSTTSKNFPAKNAYQSNHFANEDVFVTKLNTNASGAASLLYSTYLSGFLYPGGFGGVEVGYGIAADASGIVYVTGYTTSPNFPTKNAYQPSHSNVGNDVFVTKLDTNSCGANSLLYSTFLGGTGPYLVAGFDPIETGRGIAIDSLGNAYVTGFTSSSDFPSKNSLQAYQYGDCGTFACSDVFVTKLNTNVAGAAGLVYSTFLGGATHDRGLGIAVDSSGNAYVTGQAGPNFPTTPGAYQTGLNGGFFADAFVTKISDPASAPPPDADGDGVADANDICPGTPAGVTVDANGCQVSCVAPPAGMVGWWPGDGSANDIKGSNHGTLQYGATFGTGKVGQAFSFDGVDDYVSAPFTQTGPFTVDLWAKANVGCQSEFRSLIASAYPGNFPENTFQLDFDGAGNYRFRATGANTLHLTIGPASTNFQHIAVTYDGSVVRTYRNGQLTNSGTWTGAALTFTTLRIGMNRGDGAPFDGLVDEVEVFNRALSLSEIQSIYNAGSAGKCKNRAPVALCQNVTVSAGPSCTASASINNGSSDPDSDPITITQSPPGPYPLGTAAVTMTVTDNKGASSSCTATVTVVDTTKPQITSIPPDANYQCLSQVPVGSPSQATASDNCSAPAITVADASNGGTGSPGNPLVITRVFVARDAAGNTASASQIITVVDNTPPIIACPANINVVGNLLGSCSANVSVGAATATDNCSTPTVTGTRSDGQALSAPYPLGLTTITWTATDAAGNQSTCPQTVNVTNPVPVATITGPPTGSVYTVGTLATFTGSFTDNAGGTHTATWTFDSLTSAGTVTEATGAITGSFTFTTAGVYAVKLTVNDGCGGTHTTEVIGPDGLSMLVVIYDPSAGWVSGGGWFNSPAGAYAPNPSLTGKANFGFVSKYENGASVPTGNTEFHFKAGDLKFKSTSYEWMVIAGARAQYKGFGTINGSGNYRFMLTAIDGDQPGGGGQDKFRIKIWSDGGGLVYDNQLNAPDSDDPTTVLGAGSIVIHK